MNLYTIIFEFRGGTYISQVSAVNEKEALIEWCQNIDTEPIMFMGRKLKGKLQKQIKNEIHRNPPMELDNCINAWCAGIYVSGLINIIKTEKQNL